jgi:RNA polymerase sigma factor (sigma-70 family)
MTDILANGGNYSGEGCRMDDAQLIRQYAAQGSEAAFSELVGRHMTLVHSAAMRQVDGDFHHAKDVTQMVFTLLARKAGSLTGHTALTGWLYATTYFVAGNVRRGERRRRIREEETYQMNESFAHPESELNWDQLRPVLDRTLFELNERDREAILWRFFDALPLAVMAEKMGINASGAKKRVDRALDRMRVSLAKRGAASTTAALALMLESHAMVAAPAGLTEAVTVTALASAAQAGTQTSWLLQCLGKARSAVGLSGAIWTGGILGLSGIGVAAYELWAMRRANEALAQANEDYASRQKHFWALRRAAADAQPAVVRVERAQTAIRDPKANFQRFLAVYPQARAAILAEQRAFLETGYGSFFKSAGLTAAQILQFEDAMTQNNVDHMTLTPREMAIDEPPMPMPPEDQMRAILGDRSFQQLQDYGQTFYAHYFAARMAAHAATVSFSTDQLDQLAQILASNNARPQPAHSWDPASMAMFDWGKVSAQAKAAFSPAQWKAMEPALLTLQATGAENATAGSPGSAASP